MYCSLDVSVKLVCVATHLNAVKRYVSRAKCFCSLDVSVKSVFVATHLSAVKRYVSRAKCTVALALVWNRYLLQHNSICKCRSCLSTVQVSVISFLCTSVRLLFRAYKCPSSLSYVHMSVFSFLCTSVCLLFYACPSSLCTNVRLLFPVCTCLSSVLCVHVSVFSHLHTVSHLFPVYKCFVFRPDSTCCVDWAFNYLHFRFHEQLCLS